MSDEEGGLTDARLHEWIADYDWPEGATRERPAAVTATITDEPAAEGNVLRYGANDDGLARVLAEEHQHELRFCPQRGKWLRWAGHRWQWDDAEHHRELVRGISRRIADGSPYKSRGLSAAGIAGIARLAQSDPALVAPLDTLDADPWALNTPGGIIDLRTGEVGRSDPAALCTRSTACELEDPPDLGRWRQFLADTFGEDQDLMAYLQRLVGYSATGVIGAHVLPFAFGSGGNGKGVFLESMRGVLGDYATTAPNGFLMAQLHTSHETEIARLAGARMVICSEVNEDDRFDEAKVKMLTGGDTLTARFMRQDHFTFTPTHTLWLMGNNKPAVRSGGRSFWRRLRLLPFLRNVPADKVVDDLQGILVRDHGPALLAWIVAGAVDYAKGGLREPKSVTEATKAYQRDQDSVARFVAEECHLGGGVHVKIGVTALRDEYEKWCREDGSEPVSAKKLTTTLTDMGVGSYRTGRTRHYTGLALLSREEES